MLRGIMDCWTRPPRSNGCAKTLRRLAEIPKTSRFSESRRDRFRVSAQMASPVARRLVQRAIGESGGAFSARGLRFKSLAEVEKTNADWAMTTFGTSDLTALRAMSADDLLAKMKAQPRTVRSPVGPDVDGYFLTEPVSQVYAEGKQAHIPLMAGWNRDEPSALVANHPQPATVASFQETAQKSFSERCGCVSEAVSGGDGCGGGAFDD